MKLCNKHVDWTGIFRVRLAPEEVHNFLNSDKYRYEHARKKQLYKSFILVREQWF